MTGRARRTLVGAFTALTVTLIGGCAVDRGPAVPDTPDPGSTATLAPTTDASLSDVDDIPRDDLIGEHLVVWSSIEEVDERHLRVRFTAGNPVCLGTRALVREDEQQVSIATIEGTLPEAPEVCSLIGREASLLKLHAPLGQRKVRPLTIDGEIPDA